MTTTETDTSRPAPDPAPGRPPEPPALGFGDQVHFQRYQRKGSFVLWGIFILLLALTGGVFFVLPKYVAPPEAAIPVVVVPTANSSPGATLALSPFEEAQRMRQREAAQNALQALLELQKELELKQVLGWAAADFNSGIEKAREGDAAYRQQQYLEAANLYQAGVDQLQAIRDGEGEIFARSMAAGSAALLAGDAEEANAAFSQALLIRPDSEEAVAGLERATVLNQVLSLLDNGRNLQAAGQLEAARDLYRQAQQLDSANQDSSRAIESANQAIAARDFSQAMSRGFSALQNGDPDAARRAFEQAGALRPGSSEVAAALQQAQDRQTFTAISVHLEAAQQHEAAERWQQALEAWNQALAIDPNLVSALDGQQRTQSRSNLDQFLETTIANPLRLAEDSIYQQTQQVLTDAGRLPNIGPRLQNQLQQVAGFVERARIPVSVQLQSDGMTQVTLFRIGALGQFTSQTLTLVPGEYTAVGVRPGYRDVRQEFVVGLDGQALSITVACTETI
jgi:tetratricopeptide (TPR) repeat protein